MPSKLLEAALEYCDQGLPIFPCRADKTPYTENGVIDATTDKDQIKKWWKRWPSANIGLNVGEAGMMVLDFDPGSSMKEVEKNVGKLPKTGLVAETPRGGYHYYFLLGDGEVVSPSASKVAEAVDVRSFHSYVILPPGRTADGEYSWAAEGKPAYRTDDLVRVANAYREKDPNRHNWIIEPDLDENVAAAVKWLRDDAKIAVEGRNGDAMAYATAAHMKSFGISEPMALNLMWDYWNPRNVPPWDADEFDHFEAKVRNGYSYSTSPPGNITTAYKAAKTSQLFSAVSVDTPSADEDLADDGARVWKWGRFRMRNRAAMNYIPDPTWTIHNALPSDAYAILYAPEGSFKTFMALDMALSVASGFPINPAVFDDGAIVDPGPVLYMTGEGYSNMLKRVRAWEALHNGGREVERFTLVDPTPHLTDDPAQLAEYLLGNYDSYSLVILDTVSRVMQGVNENEQQNVSNFTKLVDGLRRGLGGPTVLAIHHTGKDGKTIRGSSVFRTDADVVMRVTEKSAAFQSAASDKTYLTSILFEKMKDAPEPEPIEYLMAEVHTEDEARQTLVAVSAKQAEVSRGTKPEAVTAKKHHKGDAEKFSEERRARADTEATAAAIENAAIEALESYPGTRFTTNKLAEQLVHDGHTDLSSRTLRRHLNNIKLRGKLAACYTPATGVFLSRKRA